MAIEGALLTKRDEEMIRECLAGKKTFEEAEVELLDRYIHGQCSDLAHLR
ncbi:MAG: hypothetical protein RR619_12515 [Raoultibacter sp.]